MPAPHAAAGSNRQGDGAQRGAKKSTFASPWPPPLMVWSTPGVCSLRLIPLHAPLSPESALALMLQTTTRVSRPPTPVTASRCVQTRISSPTDAAAAFMASVTRDITLVAVPADTCCCVQFVSIPSGFFVLGQRWHKNIGALDPGFKMCWPFYYLSLIHI